MAEQFNGVVVLDGTMEESESKIDFTISMDVDKIYDIVNSGTIVFVKFVTSDGAVSETLHVISAFYDEGYQLYDMFMLHNLGGLILTGREGDHPEGTINIPSP